MAFSSATVRVEKATSEFLIGPDWTLNMEICDLINSDQMLAKDVVKAVKKRLQHKNPKVQLLALTLLETMGKNCGDYVHFQIAEKKILQEMVKIVKKKTDMHVRNKVLTLISSWHEAFGGSGGRYPQYYMAYEDLMRFGVQFPRRPPDSAPIFTPAAAHAVPRPPQLSYGMPGSSTTRLDEAMTADDNLSLSSLNSMCDVLELLTDMLQAVDRTDPLYVKDEIIVDLVEQCRVNQQKLMRSLGSTRDEELLCQGLDLNDKLQSVVAKHDAIASGSHLPPEVTPTPPSASENQESGLQSPEVVPPAAMSDETLPVPVFTARDGVGNDEDDEDDDFVQLARRHSKARRDISPSSPTSNALVPIDTPTSVEMEDQNIIELLSIVLSTDASNKQTSASPMHPPNHPPSTEAFPRNNGLAFNNYVTPWAQPPQPQPRHQPQFPTYQPPSPPSSQPELQPQYPQHACPPPPWATTPGYFSGNQNSMTGPTYTYSAPSLTTSNNGQPGRYDYTNREVSAWVNPGQKAFVPSYRLFEDLDVFGNGDGRYKSGSNGSVGLSESSCRNMVGGMK